MSRGFVLIPALILLALLGVLVAASFRHASVALRHAAERAYHAKADPTARSAAANEAAEAHAGLMVQTGSAKVSSLELERALVLMPLSGLQLDFDSLFSEAVLCPESSFVALTSGSAHGSARLCTEVRPGPFIGNIKSEQASLPPLLAASGRIELDVVTADAPSRIIAGGDIRIQHLSTATTGFALEILSAAGTVTMPAAPSGITTIRIIDRKHTSGAFSLLPQLLEEPLSLTPKYLLRAQ